MHSVLRFTLLVALLASTFAVAAEQSSQPAYSSGVTTKILLRTQVDGAGQPIVYPAGAPAEVTAVHVTIAPGQQTNWHTHPVPCFAYMLEGEITVETADGKKHTFKAGDAVPEVVNVLHNGTNAGTTPARLVLFVIGTAGQPFAVKAPSP